MIARNAVVDEIRKVYERYGFVPLDTPILEHLAVLAGTGGEETSKQIFTLHSPEHESIALRFDLTVPFARLIAQYPEELRLPFRRYHIGPVFRADKPGPGRYRQFTQFDIDAAGSASVAVDAEIVAAMADTLRALGLSNPPGSADGGSAFVIRVNNRKLVDALLDGYGITSAGHRETQKHILRVIDKLQKVGVDEVRKELGAGRLDESGDPIPGVGLQPAVISGILDFISVGTLSRAEMIEALARLLPTSAQTTEAIQEMSNLAAALVSLGVTEEDVVFDPSLARGLDYYTGPVFEALLSKAPEFGSVMGGGRYDQLVERFLDTQIPATGMSIGIDRLISALQALDQIETSPTTTQVLIVSLGAIPATELLAMASELRSRHIATEIYFGPAQTSLRDQLSVANSRGVPVAVIVGEDELRAGEVAIKDLFVGRTARADIADRDEYRRAGRAGQVTVPRARMVEAVASFLSNSYEVGH